MAADLAHNLALALADHNVAEEADCNSGCTQAVVVVVGAVDFVGGQQYYSEGHPDQAVSHLLGQIAGSAVTAAHLEVVADSQVVVGDSKTESSQIQAFEAESAAEAADTHMGSALVEVWGVGTVVEVADMIAEEVVAVEDVGTDVAFGTAGLVGTVPEVSGGQDLELVASYELQYLLQR